MTALGEVTQSTVLSADSKDLSAKELTLAEWNVHKGLLLRSDIPESRKKDYLKKVSINSTYQGSTLLHELCDPVKAPRSINAMLVKNYCLVGSKQNDPKILEQVRFLLANDADPNVLDNQGNTALFIAAQFDQLAIVKLLLKPKYKTDVHLGERYSVLHGAAGAACVSTLKLLIEQKAEVDRINPLTKETPLSVAVVAKFSDLKRVEEDASEAKRREESFTEVINSLLEAKADPTLQTIEHYSPFFQYVHYSSEKYTKNRQKVIQSFLRAGASIIQFNGGDSKDVEASVKTKPVATPLSRAITRGNFLLVQDLLKAAGSNLDINSHIVMENSSVLTAIAVSMEQKKQSSEMRPEKRGYWVPENFTEKYFMTTILNLAVAIAEDKFIVALLEAKAALQVTDEFGSTALHLACFLGRYDAVVMLVKKANQQKVPLNIQCKSGYTPLHAASESGHDKIVRFLLQYKGKIDVNAKSKEKGTALHVAASLGHFEVVRSLIANGAEIDPLLNGYTPLVFAVMKGHANIVEQLIDSGADMFLYANPNFVSPLYISLCCQQYEIAEIILTYYRNFFSKEWVQRFEKLFNLLLLFFDRAKCSHLNLNGTKQYSFAEDGPALERIRLIELFLLQNVLKLKNSLEVQRALSKLDEEAIKDEPITSQELQEVRQKYNQKVKVSDIKEEVEPSKIVPRITFLKGRYSQQLFLSVARAPNHVFVLAEKNLVERGCSPDNLKIFARVRPKFCSPQGESGLKKLTSDKPVEIWVSIEGELRQVTITCELKTLASHSSGQRVLCFKIPSDQDEGCLIIGAIFAKHLDKSNELTNWHMAWTKEKPLIINLQTQLVKKETVQALCSMGLLTSFDPLNLKGKDEAITDTIMDYYGSPELPSHRM